MTEKAEEKPATNNLASLRARVAAALYGEGGKCLEDFHSLSEERQGPWMEDADRVIPVVIAACARVIEQRDPEKPGAYLIRREHLSSHIEGLFVGCNEWECPIGEDGCLSDCGSYACHN